MFNSGLLDIVIDLGAIYLLLSIVCSAINEWIAALWSVRAKTLEAGLMTMLAYAPVASGVLNDPLVRNLAKEGKQPSYIPSRLFSLALFRTLMQPPVTQPALSGAAVTPLATTASMNMPSIVAAINSLPPGDLKRSLQTLLDDARMDYELFRTNVEQWFNSEMERVSGWYKRWSQIVVLVLAAIIVVAGNVDSIHIANRLWADPALRAALAQLASKDIGQNPDPAHINHFAADVAKVALPIGWEQPMAIVNQNFQNDHPTLASVWPWLLKVFGLAATLIAVSMGAPTWFDILSKATSIRLSGDVPK